MKIVIETIQSHEQRYDTLGDYWVDENGVYQVRITEGDVDYHPSSILMHELCEMLLCIHRGIDLKSIDQFDMDFKGEGEPGAEINAPYHKEHVVAEIVERIMDHELGVEHHE